MSSNKSVLLNRCHLGRSTTTRSQIASRSQNRYTPLASGFSLRKEIGVVTFLRIFKPALAPLLFAVVAWPSLAQTPKTPPQKTEDQTPTVEEAPPRDASTAEIEELKKLEASLQESLLEQEKNIEPPSSTEYEGSPPQNNTKLRRDSFSTEDLLQDTPTKAAPKLEKLVDLSTLAPLDIEYIQDPMVEAYLEFFLTKGRGFMKHALEKRAKYIPMMEKIFEEEGVPTDLYGIGVIESGYNPKAYSYASASGIWQFIPGTGRAYGLRNDSWFDERRSPEKETRAAARLFKDLYKQFGSWELAFAAYNGGPGTVVNNCRKYNTNNFWEMAHLGGFPDQTRFYVPKAIAAAIVVRNAKALGFTELKEEPVWEFDLVHLPSGQISTALLAKAAGIDEARLLEYNPEILKGFTPPEVPEFLMRVPKGSGEAFQTAMKNLWPKGKVTFGRHIVRQGEKIEELAKYYGLPTATLQNINNLTAGVPLVGGTPLLVPLSENEEPRANTNYEESEAITAAFPAEFTYPNRKVVYYRARAKDTIENLALAFEVEEQEIALWNGLDINAKLISGMVVRLYVPDQFEPSKVILLDPVKVKAVVRAAGTNAKGSSLIQPPSKGKKPTKKTVKKKAPIKKKH
jgi:membrane-bound lytic murein transglycosylase D